MSHTIDLGVVQFTQDMLDDGPMNPFSTWTAYVEPLDLLAHIQPTFEYPGWSYEVGEQYGLATTMEKACIAALGAIIIEATRIPECSLHNHDEVRDWIDNTITRLRTTPETKPEPLNG